MSAVDVLSMFAAMVLLAVLPSSSVALVVTRSAMYGVKHGLLVAVGIVLGDLFFIAMAIFGLTLAVQALGGFFIVIKYLGACYLIWLGITILRSNAQGLSVDTDNGPSKGSFMASFVSGFLLTLGDLKAIVFYASFFPLFLDITTVTVPNVVAVCLVTIVAVGGVKAVYAIVGAKANTILKGGKAEVIVKNSAGSLLVGAGSYILIKQ